MKVGDRGKIFLPFQMRGQEAEVGSLICRVEGSGGREFSEAEIPESCSEHPRGDWP